MTHEIQSEDTAEYEMQGNEEPFNAFGNPAPDWRVWFGAIFSVLWIGMLSMYIAGTVGWGNIRHAPIATMGNFLEGAFAPLAFLWLVIGYFLQKKELVQNTNAIKMQYVEIQKSAAQAEIQTHAIKASELHARKESFLRIADSVKQQLGTRMGYLYLSSQGSTGSAMVSSDKIGDLWSSMNQNDPEIFSRSMMQVSMSHGEIYAYKLFYGTDIRTKHCENFVFNFERLIRAAEECDDDGMIKDSLLGSAHGFIYERMLKFKNTPPPGFIYGEYEFDPDTFDAPVTAEHSK
jgi:hypothetical protein